MAGGSGTETETGGLVNTLQEHIDDLRNSLQCGICVRPLYEPFTLACGHTFCYTCLSSWFLGGRSKRTCPDCRAPVKTQPAPAYLVRTIVQMFTSRPELLDKEETTADHSLSHREEIEKLDKDKANADPHNGGLFGGLFNPKPPSLKPIVDVDDGVARCPMCSWELEDDHTCGGCGWLYRSDSDASSELSESDLSMTDEYDSALEDDDIEEDGFGVVGAHHPSTLGPYGGPPNYGFPPAVMGPSWGHMHVPFPFYHHHHFPPPRPMGAIPLDEEDDYDEEEDDDYDDLDSFIDDDEQNAHGHVQGADFDPQSDHSTMVNGTRPMNPPSSRAPPAYSYHPHHAWFPAPPRVPTDDEDEESDHTEYRGNYMNATSWAPGDPPTSASRSSSSESASEEEEGEEDEEEASVDGDEDLDGPHAGRSRPHFYQPSCIIPGSDDESAPDDSSSPPRPMRSSRPAGLSAGNAITIDDSDEDQPVGPIRRTAQRRQARFSPY